MIKKVNNKWVVLSHTTGRRMGDYTTKKKAEARLKQIKMFGKIKRRLK